ncbi:MAG: DUF3307 domain-containing protein [Anaerolineales bacterium]|nr:DUF3307 domain-containing protein [Anaerolineales bacterium]
MLVPQLIFAHLLADFIFQTKRIVEMKTKGWYGLFLHGGTFYITALYVLPSHLKTVFIPITLLSIEHTFQDWVKIKLSRLTPRFGVFWYFLDQLCHFLGIFILNAWVGDKVTSNNTEILLFMIGSSVIVLTRAWEITVMSNWARLRQHVQQWNRWADVERLAALALVSLGGLIAVPFGATCVIPRFVMARRQGIKFQKLEYLEVGGGIICSIILGLGIWNLLQYI